MIAVFIFGLLVGLDNFQVIAGLGLMGVEKKKRYLLIGSFAFCEMMMPLLGLYLGQQFIDHFGTVGGLIGPLFLLGFGLYIIAGELMEGKKKRKRNSLWFIWMLPLVMSFDNLLAGIGFGALGYPIWITAAIIGAMSGLLSFAGLLFGEKARYMFSGKAELVSGFYAIGLAIFFLIN